MKIDPSKLTVRKADISDVPVLVAYRVRYLTELQGEMDERYKLKLVDDLTRYFDRALTDGRFIAFYARLEETIVSFGGMVVKEIPGESEFGGARSAATSRLTGEKGAGASRRRRCRRNGQRG